MKTTSQPSITGASPNCQSSIVNCQFLSKSYGKVQALHDVSFSADKGEIFGIIGPDGAGKTTLFRILTTLILADQGTAQLNGLDVVKDYRTIRRLIGYMPGRFSLYQDLSVEENLRFFATIFQTDIQTNYHLIKDIYQQIEPFKDRKAGQLSGGMKQKLALCCALIHKPLVLFLDEPTTGVDPVSRAEFWEMLARMKAQGLCIVVSTPYMDEASLCDRIALMQGGRFLQTDTPANIINGFSETLWTVRSNRMHHLLSDLRSYPGIKRCFAFGESDHIIIDDSVTAQALREYLQTRGHQGIEINPATPTLEDCFIQLLSENHE